MDNANKLDAIRQLSEKSGVEMIIIDEAEKITKSAATRFLRDFIGRSYINDPIKSSIRQESPRTKTVELPGISLLVEYYEIQSLIDTLNSRFLYRNYIAFISDDSFREDKKQTISIIHSADKYNVMRLQEISGGSSDYSTENLISKLQSFEQKYPFTFIGVGSDRLLIKLNSKPTNWIELANEINKICPDDETTIENLAKELEKEKGRIFMWWD